MVSFVDDDVTANTQTRGIKRGFVDEIVMREIKRIRKLQADNYQPSTSGDKTETGSSGSYFLFIHEHSLKNHNFYTMLDLFY